MKVSHYIIFPETLANSHIPFLTATYFDGDVEKRHTPNTWQPNRRQNIDGTKGILSIELSEVIQAVDEYYTMLGTNGDYDNVYIYSHSEIMVILEKPEWNPEEIIDLDEDGNPDKIISGTYGTNYVVTEDKDSINIFQNDKLTVIPKEV